MLDLGRRRGAPSLLYQLNGHLLAHDASQQLGERSDQRHHARRELGLAVGSRGRGGGQRIAVVAGKAAEHGMLWTRELEGTLQKRPVAFGSDPAAELGAELVAHALSRGTGFLGGREPAAAARPHSARDLAGGPRHSAVPGWGRMRVGEAGGRAWAAMRLEPAIKRRPGGPGETRPLKTGAGA